METLKPGDMLSDVLIVNDRINGIDSVAQVRINTVLQNGDCIEVISVENEEGEVFVSDEIEHQVKSVFIREHETEYNDALLSVV